MPKSLHSGIQQIPLSQMERGLAQPVATIDLEPAEISSRLGVQFENSRDDLDELEAAVVCGKSGRQFALVRHLHQPNDGTDILTNERSRNLTDDLREILRVLQLSIHELRWTHPDIRAKELEDFDERSEGNPYSSQLRAGKASEGVYSEETEWTLVLNVREHQNTQLARDALAALCHIYWYPLYAFARKLGHRLNEAQDLTQGFFVYLLEMDLFSKADRTQGRLRIFLLTAFTRYINRERSRTYARKHSGGLELKSLEEGFTDGERRYRLEPVAPATPEEIYSRSWAKALLKAAKEQLETKETAAGRGEAFKVLEPFLEQEPDESISYQSVALRLSISQPAVRMAVRRLRERYRKLLREQISNTLRDPTEKNLETELKALRAALR
jgi:DNA-directed RNA polymerase specialized sigma24 family protein